ncbi:PBP1A family penicillin-binding protein [Hyphomicrobium sp.]|uniref:transglycosylase domain-containing protein n=1 Tax=Hyphomicrobium sp. TaxID=82 RepID=UPI002D79DAB9|nr:PBP1A family penicillin-binding protein [Hyphomicrobium sp.]HET6388359.1 PBP1A family penicillin-binding protein [Hyphomicrobium sp.]
MLRAIAAALRFALWLLRGMLLGGRRAPAPEPGPTLPGSFQSVAEQAFRRDEEPSDFVNLHLRPPQPQALAGPAPPRRGLLARLSLKHRLALSAAVLGSGVLALTFAVMMVYYTVVFPDPLAIRNSAHTPLVRILARDGSVLTERGAPREYVPLEQLGKLVPAAVVATEDRRFFDHYGVDPAGMIRAMFANLRAGRFAQGGSTLTQQLAKNLFLTQDRTLTRKIAELGLAFWLEVRLSKPEILELYLNQVYFGGGAWGVEAASRKYFDKPTRELTLPEAALIAGLLKAPSKYSPAASPGAARARARVVIGKMFDAGFITEEQETQALAQTLVFNEQKIAKAATDAGYVGDYVLEQLQSITGADDIDLVVETTIDKTLQHRAQEIVADSLAKKGAALGASQAAVAVLDRDGGIRALVGGRDYGDSQFNRATKAKRQPGSAFKPFVYLAALQRGISPDTIIDDAPITIGGWSPKNDKNEYAGPITLRRALAQSVNTVAVRLNQDIGRGKAADLAVRLGIKSDLREGPALALGTSEVSLLEIAGAYTAFSNGGDVVEPHIIVKVSTGSGRVLFEMPAPVKDHRIAEADRLGALNDMLNAAVVYGTGKRAALPDQPVAGKTGTTQDFRDAWFIGYTSHLTAGVWVGNDNGKPMNRTTGGTLPAEIWKQIMRVAHEGLPSEPLPGTVMASAGEDAADFGINPLVPTASAARPPRVVEASETLASPSRRDAKAGPAVLKAIAENARALPASQDHAPARIDESFIARAVATLPGEVKAATGDALKDITPVE